jgi:predicted nucleic acid-binding protein
VRYFDTSALVKQYLQEAGSKTVLGLLKTGEKVYTASLTYAETHAAFSRRTRQGRLTRETARKLALRFDKDWESYDIVILSENVLSLTRQMLYRYPLRSADAIHLASALLLADQPNRSLGICPPTADSAIQPKPRASQINTASDAVRR